LCEELAKSYALGVAIGILVQCEMATSTINEFGSKKLKDKLLPLAIKGEKIFALGITEPNFGSNVAGIQTKAKKEGENYLINGAKTFISNGTRADYITLAVRTGEAGAKGISLIVFPTNTPGFSVSKKLKKMGTRCGDLAELTFTDCKVPQEYLIGEENKGFYYIMKCFQGERIVLSAFALGLMELLLQEAKKYGMQREVFGTPILKNNYWKQKYADLITLFEASRQLTYYATDKLNKSTKAQKEVSCAKLFACTAVKKIANEVLQLYGGYGYMEEYPICRIYRDVSAFTIGAGTSEIMREIIAKEEGL